MDSHKYVYTVKELATRWSCTKKAVTLAILRCDLPAFRLGSSYRVKVDAAVEYEKKLAIGPYFHEEAGLDEAGREARARALGLMRQHVRQKAQRRRDEKRATIEALRAYIPRLQAAIDPPRYDVLLALITEMQGFDVPDAIRRRVALMKMACEYELLSEKNPLELLSCSPADVVGLRNAIDNMLMPT